MRDESLGLNMSDVVGRNCERPKVNLNGLFVGVVNEFSSSSHFITIN